MIAYIKGKLVEKNPTYLIIESGGLGYMVHISLHTYSQIPDQESVKLFTHFHVREDAQSLYGFSSKTEREIFRLLISVSGVGTATARVMLSSMSPKEIQQAIASDNANLLKTVKGIGVKTAQRIIIDLRDKIIKTYDIEAISTSIDNTAREEALSALDVLGFSRKQTQRIIDNILRDEPAMTIENLIKQALKNL
ncbi:MAG TPA: Holliday junction branch migration protein RuvA [Lutibacter sp.]|nr:Holliday junction branch migration protein RuvA [Lutibacter sp.]